MYALCVSGAVNTQGFVWKFFYALYINFHSFIHVLAINFGRTVLSLATIPEHAVSLSGRERDKAIATGLCMLVNI